MCVTKPEQISIEAFMYGFFMILGLELDEVELRGRIDHGKLLLHHAVLHGWPSARRYHYKVLWAMEHENLSWQNREQMWLLSMSAAQESNHANGTLSNSTVNNTHMAASNKKTDIHNKSIFCYLFNNDATGCKFEKTAEGCKKLHACSACAEKGFFNKHRSAFDCRK
jgi:hypothetical protein